jgi:hypothetical protein
MPEPVRRIAWQAFPYGEAHLANGGRAIGAFGADWPVAVALDCSAKGRIQQDAIPDDGTEDPRCHQSSLESATVVVA